MRLPAEPGCRNLQQPLQLPLQHDCAVAVHKAGGQLSNGGTKCSGIVVETAKKAVPCVDCAECKVLH